MRCESGVSTAVMTAQERRHRSERGTSARRGSDVIAAATLRGRALQHGRGVGGASGVSSLRGRGVRGRQYGVGGVIAAREGRHRSVELAFCPCQRNRFCPCQGTFLVGGVTVDSVERPCKLVNAPEAKRKFCFDRREPVEGSGGHAAAMTPLPRSADASHAAMTPLPRRPSHAAVTPLPRRVAAAMTPLRPLLRPSHAAVTCLPRHVAAAMTPLPRRDDAPLTQR